MKKLNVVFSCFLLQFSLNSIEISQNILEEKKKIENRLEEKRIQKEKRLDKIEEERIQERRRLDRMVDERIQDRKREK